MVVRIILGIALLLCYLPQAMSQEIIQDEALSAAVSKADKQWGQYMRVTLRYLGRRPLQDIDLNQWQRVAEIKIEDEYRDTDELNRNIQIMKLRLYPRSIGTIQLPALTLGNAVSAPLELISTEPVVEDSQIKLEWSVSKQIAWEREAILVRTKLITDDYAARVKLDPIEQQQYLSHILRLQATQLPDGRYEHRSGWVIYPLNAGEQTLTLPSVRYQLSGSDRRRFHLPRQKLDIKPLPAYLPPILPVGRLGITTQIVQDQNSTKKWQITLQSQGLIPYGSPGLDRQLADISGHDISSIEIQTTQSFDAVNIVNKADYLVPLPKWMLPLGPDINIKLRYFDTKNGRLVTQVHTLPRQINMPAWAWYISYALFIFAIAITLYHARNYIIRYSRKIRLRNKIRNAASAQEIRAAILSDGQYPSLTQWSIAKDYRKAIAHEINQNCFAREKHEPIDTLKNKLLLAL